MTYTVIITACAASFVIIAIVRTISLDCKLHQRIIKKCWQHLGSDFCIQLFPTLLVRLYYLPSVANLLRRSSPFCTRKPVTTPCTPSTLTTLCTPGRTAGHRLVTESGGLAIKNRCTCQTGRRRLCWIRRILPGEAAWPDREFPSAYPEAPPSGPSAPRGPRLHRQVWSLPKAMFTSAFFVGG